MKGPALALLIAVGLSCAAVERPNIIFILADDWGHEALGANGGNYTTPHIDALAATGMRCTNAYAQPLCTPSRVQVMTGQYNFRNYVGFGVLKPGEHTFGHLLRDAGYTTAMVGKWQLGGDEQAPAANGFAHWQLWQLIGGRTERYRGAQGFWQDGMAYTHRADEYGPEVHQRYARDFIRANRNRSFLLYYALTLPHDPFHAAPPLTRADSDAAKYASMVTYLDRYVGEVVADLRELGIAERTLVVVTGDNGTSRSITSTLHGKPYRGGKGQPNRRGTWVPFVAAWPSRIAPGVCDDLIDFTDLLPTFAETAGVDTTGLRLDGQSILPRLTGKVYTPRQAVYGWYLGHDKKLPDAVWAHDGRHVLYGDGRLHDWITDQPAGGPLADAARPRLAAEIARFAAPDPAMIQVGAGGAGE